MSSTFCWISRPRKASSKGGGLKPRLPQPCLGRCLQHIIKLVTRLSCHQLERASAEDRRCTTTNGNVSEGCMTSWRCNICMTALPDCRYAVAVCMHVAHRLCCDLYPADGLGCSQHLRTTLKRRLQMFALTSHKGAMVSEGIIACSM